MKPSRDGRRAKRATRRWHKQSSTDAPRSHWLDRHEAEREQADDALTRLLEKDADRVLKA